MSSRSQRSVVQPVSYRDFNETGHKVIPEGLEVDQEDLIQQNSKETQESGESQSDEFDHDNEHNVTHYRSHSRFIHGGQV